MSRLSYTIAALTLASVLGLGGMLAWQLTRPEPVAVPGSHLDQALYPATYRLVHALEAEAEQGTGEAAVYTRLGYAYLQSARENPAGDYTDGAERAFQRALALDPMDAEAMSGLGLVRATDHQFADALTWGQKALAANPHRAATYGLIVDAYLELGRYDHAIEAAQKMVDMRPDQASYSRISYLRELHGDLDGAADAMARAVSAGSGTAENTAWCRVYLGHLYARTGDLAAAERAYRTALLQVPNYGHALAGLASIALMQGQTEEAISRYKDAVDVYPIPEFLIALGEAYTATGRIAYADAQFAEALATLEAERSGGMDVDEELALLLLENNGDSARALDLAQGAYERRPTVKNANILAWALYRNGRSADALPLAIESLRLGTPELAWLRRAAAIAEAAGCADEARKFTTQAALLDPHLTGGYLNPTSL